MTTRRDFIKLVASGTSALVLGVRFAFPDDQRETKDLRPHALVRIETDGSIVIVVDKSELGQGVRTSLPMILAEELDADFGSVRIEQASPGPMFLAIWTGGSTSIMRDWDSMRTAGATARAMLVSAAATKWNVEPEACVTEKSTVIHPPTNRKASYGDLVGEAAKLKVPSNPLLKKRSDYKLLGTSMKRLDGPEIVSGRARYGIDIRLPGMLYAVVARPPVLGARVGKFDATRAREVPGVREVVQISRGVAVVAENTWSAIKGRDALDLEWTESPNASFDSAIHIDALEKVTETPGVTIRTDGDGRAAMERATKTFESVYRYPFAAHASVEPVNCTVSFKDGKCEIWSPTQTPNSIQGIAPRILGVPGSAVRVNVTLAGGGFGRRLNTDFDQEALEIAKQMEGTPVHLTWTREDDIAHGHFQAASVHRMVAGLDEHGSLVAFEHRKASSPHNLQFQPPEAMTKNSQVVREWAWGVYDSPYWFNAAEMTYSAVNVPLSIGPWRAVFSPSSVFARECFIDEIAHETQKDPIDLRLEMLGKGNAEIPENFEIAGELIERPRLHRVIETVAKVSGWGERLPNGRAMGMAANFYHTGTQIAYVVEVSKRSRTDTGQLPFVVHKVVCAVDCGLAINPNGVRQQVESGVIWALSNMKNEITVREGRVQESNYDSFPVTMIGETPPIIDIHIVGSDAEAPHGLGEPVVCPLTPAVVNALSRLAGKRIRALPIRAEDLA